jgi:hypothetical protein
VRGLKRQLEELHKHNNSPSTWVFQRKDFFRFTPEINQGNSPELLKLFEDTFVGPSQTAGFLKRDLQGSFVITQGNFAKAIEIFGQSIRNIETQLPALWAEAYKKAQETHGENLRKWNSARAAFYEAEKRANKPAVFTEEEKKLRLQLEQEIAAIRVRRNFCYVMLNETKDAKGVSCDFNEAGKAAGTVSMTWLGGFFAINNCSSTAETTRLANTLEICQYMGPVSIGRCTIQVPGWPDSKGRKCAKEWAVSFAGEILGAGCFESAEDALKYMKISPNCED